MGLQRIATILCFVAVMVAGAGPAAADPQLEGRVLEKTTGKPVARAAVSILGYPGERLTDDEGRFTWQPAPSPPFEVLVVLPGGRYTRPVLVERFDRAGIDIVVESLITEAVTVAAGAAPSVQSPPAAGMTLVTSTEIQTSGPATLAQTLENVAGVSTVSEGHAAAPAVRGFSAGRTLILLDGARVTSERRVGPSATFLDPFVLEAVEVVRGPASVAYGSDAFGGVIAARTRRVAPGSPLAVRVAGTLGAGVPEWRGGVEIAQGLARGGVLVQVHAREFSDYRAPSADVFNSGGRDRGVLARVEHEAGPGTLSAVWQSDAGRDIGRPRDNSRTVRFYYPRETSHRLTMGYEVPRLAGFERVSLTFFTGRYAVVTDQDRFATVDDARSIERADVSARDFHVRTSAERAVGRAYLTFGTDANGRHGLEAIAARVAFDAAGSHLRTDRTTAVENARRIDAALFASVAAPLAPRLLLGAGARGDRVTTANRGGYFGERATAQQSASGYTSVSLGAIHGFTLTGQVARGFRDPLLSDRYYRGPTGRGFITGNPDLDPERSLQFDAALRYTAPQIRVAAYAFSYRISDLIERFQTEPDFFFFRNRGRSRIQGLEVEAQATLAQDLTAQLAAQLTRGRADGEGRAVDGIPPPSVSLQLRRALGVRGYLQARGAAHARADRPGPTERVTPGYGVLDLGAGWLLTPALELRAAGRNVLDKEYLVSADTRTVPAPGASASVTLVVRFGQVRQP